LGDGDRRAQASLMIGPSPQANDVPMPFKATWHLAKACVPCPTTSRSSGPGWYQPENPQSLPILRDCYCKCTRTVRRRLAAKVGIRRFAFRNLVVRLVDRYCVGPERRLAVWKHRGLVDCTARKREANRGIEPTTRPVRVALPTAHGHSKNY
jgi:hypothetical protein